MKLQDLSVIKDRVNAELLHNSALTRVMVGMATCGIASGATPVMNKLAELAKGNDEVFVSQTGCIGICQYEPIVEVIDKDGTKTT